MKKLFALVLSLLLMLALFSACSPKDDNPEEESPKDNAEEGTLSYGGDYVADDKEWDALP